MTASIGFVDSFDRDFIVNETYPSCGVVSSTLLPLSLKRICEQRTCEKRKGTETVLLCEQIRLCAEHAEGMVGYET